MPSTFTSSVVIKPDTIASDGSEGPFRAVAANGQLPTPTHNEKGTYTMLVFGRQSIVFQGGGVSTY